MKKTNARSMRNNFINKLVIVLLLSVALLCSTFAISGFKANAVMVDLPSGFIADEYTIGDRVDFPQSISVEYEGNEYSATNGTVRFPDNAVYKAGTLTLNMLGEYSANYYFQVGGKSHVANKRFTVSNKLYSLSTTNGSIVAVSADDQADKTYTSSSDNVMLTKKDGLIVRLEDKNTFSYMRSIDLTNVDENGLCNLITLDYNLDNFALNNVEGGYDENDDTTKWKKYAPTKTSAKYCIIRLTDSYDPNNYVELVMYHDAPRLGSGDVNEPLNTKWNINGYEDATGKWVDAKSGSYYLGYFSARAVGQKRSGAKIDSGADWGGFKHFMHDGQKYGAYFDNRFGTGSLQQLGQTLTTDHLPYTWKYDYKTNCVYMSVGDRTALVTSLSNLELYGEKAFKGFSKDKVRLSIFMSEYYSGNSGRVDITSIGTETGASLVENYGKIGFVDDVAVPEIKINITNTDSTGIYVPIGQELQIPSATVMGGDRYGSYDVLAYANYGTDNEFHLPIIDGKIKVENKYQYVIRYVAKSEKGGIGDAFLYVNPLESQKAIDINVSFDQVGTLKAGQEFILPEHSVNTVNATNNVSVSITAVHQNETVVINASDRKFIPKYAGEYTIVYNYKDNVFSDTKEFSVTVEASDAVAILNVPIIQKYLIKGASYSFENATAYSFSSGKPVVVNCTAYISFDGGAYAMVSDMSNVKITGSQSAKFKFVCGSGSNIDEAYSETAKIVDVNYAKPKNLTIKNYFSHDNFYVKPYDRTTRYSNLSYDLISSTGNNKIEFINAIDVETTDIEFTIPQKSCEYNKLRFTLTDFYDSNNTFVLDFVNRDGICFVSVNGNEALKTTYPFAIEKGRLKYNSATKELSILDGSVIAEINWLDYFTSKLCYFSFEILEVKGDKASIQIDSVNGQTVAQNGTNNNEDKFEPSITYVDCSGQYDLNAKINLKKPTVVDVYSTVINSNVSMKVEWNGNIMHSVDGVRLDTSCFALRDYQIVLSQPGTYRITYYATDGFGNSMSRSFNCLVGDTVAPTIEFVKSYGVGVNEFELGEEIDLRVSVYDEYTVANNVNLKVVVNDVKSGTFIPFSELILKINYLGDFKIFVIATDESGNSSYVEMLVKIIEPAVEDEGGVE